MLTFRNVDQTNDELLLGPEGKNLLSALTAFVAAAVHVPPEAHIKQGRVLHFFQIYLNFIRLLLEDIQPQPGVVADENVPLDLPKGEGRTSSSHQLSIE